ncbi:hypothetical protein V6N13_007787 [Hibiscus sabdariffa]|uniref:Uncharacterized protein n=1 Tax=Hibiscus sabdariffa TaxID=183260 RepID=A0ABR2EMN5_9ROSI
MEVTDAKSTNASTTPIVDNITGKMVAATDSKQAVATSSHPLREAIVSNETYPMEPNLAAATIHFELKIANVHTPSVTTIKQTEGANGVLSKDPTNLVATNTNVPMILPFKPLATSPFGPTMVPTTNPFGESYGFLEFLANPTETNNVAPYLYDNMGLEATTMTTLSIPIEGECENDMGKSFLATSSMLIVFDDWISKARSSSAAINDKEIPALTARGAKRRSSMQNDIKLKKPRPPPPKFFQD